jgi:hypothetical protein
MSAKAHSGIRFDPGSHVGAEADDPCLSVTLHHNQLATR